MPARGSTSTQSASSPIRSANTTTFSIPAKAVEGKTGEHLLTVRVYDRHDNVGVAKTVFGSSAK